MIPLLQPSTSKSANFAVLDVLNSGWWGNGPRCAEFEAELAQLAGAARQVLYVATWFGNGDQHLDRETGIWQCWLDYGEFLSACQEYGEALGRPGVFGQTGSVVIRK